MNKLISVLLIISSLNVFSQQNKFSDKTISGKITDAKSMALPNATITLLDQATNKLIKITQTDTSGKFLFSNLLLNKYEIIISASGFEDYKVQNLDLSSTPHYIIPDIQLNINLKKLDNVVIKGSKPLVEHKIDHLNFNVSASPLLQGLNAIETIGEAPGIEVGTDGAITYNRKSVLVLIDGRQSYLTGEALATYLRSLMANNIDHIEFYSTPPAKFDAGGGGALINIITKRIKAGLEVGINESYTQGKYPAFNSGANVSSQKNKLGISILYNYSNSLSYSNSTSQKYFYKEAEIFRKGFDTSYSKYHNWNNLFKTVLDYFIDKRSSLSLMFSARMPSSLSHPDGQTTITDSAYKTAYIEKSVSDNTTKATSIISNISFQHTIDSTASFSTSADFSSYKENDNQLLTTGFSSINPNSNSLDLVLRSFVPVDIKIGVVDFNFQKQWIKNLLELGAKTSFVRSDNEQVFERLNNGVFYKDNRSNHFIYTENINAAFASISHDSKNFKIKAGLRFEQTKGIGNQLTSNYNFTRDTSNLFPSLYMGWTADKNNELTVSYGKRIGRPSYMNLNPFIEIQDSLNYFQGNPYLSPYYIYTYSINHSFKNFIFSSFEYSDYKHIYANITNYNPDNQVTLHTIQNVNDLKLTTLTVNAVKTFKNRYNLNISNMIYNTNWNFNRQNQNNQLSKLSYYGKVKVSRSYNSGFSWQVEGVYLTESLDMLIYTGQRGYINFNFVQKILKNKGLLKLDLLDPFNLFYITGKLKYQDVNEFDVNRFGSQRARLTLTYNFSKGSVKLKQHSSASEDLQSRIGK